MKVHYTEVELGNESNPNDEWSGTLCGLEFTESPLSGVITHVSCKHCLRMYPTYKKSMDRYINSETYPL